MSVLIAAERGRSMRKHQPMKGTRTCCGLTFDKSIDYARHRKMVHTPPATFRCEVCGEEFGGPLKNHMKRHDPATAVARLLKYVDKNGPVPAHRPDLGPCWLWTKSVDTKGYGRLRVDNVLVGSHKYSWEIVNGPVPDGLEVDHLCRNRRCCNPDHLETVTRDENTRRARDFHAEQGVPCELCDFVAKAPAGLKSHMRFKHSTSDNPSHDEGRS